MYVHIKPLKNYATCHMYVCCWWLCLFERRLYWLDLRLLQQNLIQNGAKFSAIAVSHVEERCEFVARVHLLAVLKVEVIAYHL